MDDKRISEEATRRLWHETFADFLEQPDRKTAGLLLLLAQWHPEWMIEPCRLSRAD